MREYLTTCNTLPEAYHWALKFLCESGEIVACPDYNTRCKEIGMTMVVKQPLREPRISKCGIFGPEDLQQYCMEMLDGIMDFEAARGKWAYTYHQRMTAYGPDNVMPFNQVEFVVNELKRDPQSRRAVIDVRYNQNDVFTDDPACLQHIQFMIRDGALDMQVLFRSNDAVKAAFMNAFALIMLQERVAGKLGIPVGTYTHRANSFHAYERDWDILESCCRRNDLDRNMAYYYEGDWKDEMDAAIPGILAKVEKLKNGR